ncbi:MAG: hypothetical protein ACU0BS_03540 [Hasllibacter sp.]
MARYLWAPVALALAPAPPALAAGLGEEAPYAFREPAQLQVLLMGEQTRLQFRLAEGSAQPDVAAINYTFLNIVGDGNTVSVTQDGGGADFPGARVLNGLSAPTILNGTPP